MIHEKIVEETIISLLQKKGYDFLDRTDEWVQTRNLDDFINHDLLMNALEKINPGLSDEILEETIKTIERIDNPSLYERNYQFHKYLTDGITIESKKYNIFQVSHQIQFREGHDTRIPDVIVFINGIPVIVMELKTFDEDGTNADLHHAFLQLGGGSEKSGYRYDIPTLFNYNAFLVISDGATTKVGTLTSPEDRFSEWKSVNGEKGYDKNCVNQLNVLIDGLFCKEHLIDLIHNNIFFIKDKNDKPVKIMSQYHQYFGVLKSVQSILKVRKPEGNGKAGIVWHTQGSGKSFSMVMLAHRLLQSPELNVPTIVLLTDRIDLDDQLYKTFCSAREYLRCDPIIVTSRADLVKKLGTVKQGGIIFTTIGKFDKENLPENKRTNIVVMTDEAHRSHYGIYETVHYEKDEDGKISPEFKYGVEKYIRDSLPNATFIGFTGTPISNKDKQTTDVFGDIIDVYDMTQSIIDGSTVKLYYESRLAKIWTDEDVLEKIDKYYDDIDKTGRSTPDAIEKSKREMLKLSEILEQDSVVELFAQDILNHYKERKNFLHGKAMVVAQTRKGALKLYKKMRELVNPEDKEKIILVVTESNKDNDDERKIFGNSEYRKELGEEFKKDTSKYKIAIVVDMWLTGFDVPDLDVIYFIKRLKSYALMQAIARVNRVYPGKSSGLIVDYIGLGKALEAALSEYTVRDRKNNVQDVKNEIYNILKEKLSILNEWFYKVDKSKFFSSNSADRFQAIQVGTQFVLEDRKREKTFRDDLSISIKQAFVACGGIATEEEKNDVYYYLAIRSYILKMRTNPVIVPISEMNKYVASLLADAVQGDEVKVLTQGDDSVNVIELLSPDKIEKLRESNPPLVFVQIARELLERAIAESRKNNYLKSQEYSKRLRKILEEYNDRDEKFVADETIVQLVQFAQELVGDQKKADELGINGRERAFYDALVRDKSAKDLLDDETLKLIARDLKEIVDKYAKTDWANKEATRAKMRIEIRKVLEKYNYPPEYQRKAVDGVISQAQYMMLN